MYCACNYSQGGALHAVLIGQASLCMQVVAGLEPEATNAFLQLLGQATSISDGASAVQVCWAGPSALSRQGESLCAAVTSILGGLHWASSLLLRTSGPLAAVMCLCIRGSYQQQQWCQRRPGASCQGLLMLACTASFSTHGCSLPPISCCTGGLGACAAIIEWAPWLLK